MYGSSYLVTLKEAGTTGFLHKINLEEEEEAKEEGEEKPRPQVLEVGQTLEQVKIKEINYFDGAPILSMKPSVLKQSALNYQMVVPGQYLDAEVEKVNLEKHFVELRCAGLKGFLHIEHMADHPLKVIPPKFQESGKEMRVRVLNVDIGKRFLEFTKKDTLMKEDTPVFQDLKSVKKGSKVIGVVVSETEHGYVIKTFGGVKGLLTFEDIKQKEGDLDPAKYKHGSIVKAYAMFKKKDKGLALTLSKKKAKADEGEEARDEKTVQALFMPSDDQVESLLAQTKFSTMAKASKS